MRPQRIQCYPSQLPRTEQSYGTVAASRAIKCTVTVIRNSFLARIERQTGRVLKPAKGEPKPSEDR